MDRLLSTRAEVEEGRLNIPKIVVTALGFGRAFGLNTGAWAATVPVTTATELRAAFVAAQAGTTIQLAPGAYALDAPLTTMAGGTAAQPITLTSAKADGVRLDFSSADGIVVAHAYWTLDGVWLNGTCSGCQAVGLRVQPSADHLSVHSSRFTNFATGLMGERAAEAEPSDNTIDTNEFYNAPRLTEGGTPIALVGGKRWHVIGNYIHDFTGTGKHAGLSLSGGASDAVVERNMIVGSKDQPAGGTSLGFSLGGSDTPPAMCADANKAASSCTCEVQQGRVFNNIIVRTSGHGILLSRDCGSSVLLNTAYLTVPGLEALTPGPTGTLDARFNVMSGPMPGTTASVNKANVSSAAFKDCYSDPDNLQFSTGAKDALINDLQPAITEVTDDYLGDPRNATLDYGAVELKSTTRPTWPWPGTALIGTGSGPPGGGPVAPSPSGGGTAGTGGALVGSGGANGGSGSGGGAAGSGATQPDSGGSGSGGGAAGNGATQPDSGGASRGGLAGQSGGITTSDASSGADAGTAPSSSSGCACAVGAGSLGRRTGAELLCAAAAVFLAFRRQRRAARSRQIAPPGAP